MKHQIDSIVSLSVVLLLVTFCGCAEEQRLVIPETGLKGKITYKGKAVPYALVVVTGKGGSATGNADSDGNYTVNNVYPGDVEIGVNTDAGKGNMMSATMAAAQGGDKSAKPSFIEVPAKYFEPSTSGITTQIPAGSKDVINFDIVIK